MSFYNMSTSSSSFVAMLIPYNKLDGFAKNYFANEDWAKTA
jgi:hypothetical protein